MIRENASYALVELLFQVENEKALEDTESTGYLSGRWTGTSVQKNHGWKKHQQD